MSVDPCHHWDRVLYVPHPDRRLHRCILKRLDELINRDIINVWMDDEDPAQPGKLVYVITPKAYMDEWRRD